jgi:hypothetical protein
MSRNTAPVSLFSPKFRVTLAKRRANCRDVLSGTKPELLIPQQAALAYFAENPGV